MDEGDLKFFTQNTHQLLRNSAQNEVRPNYHKTCQLTHESKLGQPLKSSERHPKYETEDSRPYVKQKLEKDYYKVGENY